MTQNTCVATATVTEFGVGEGHLLHQASRWLRSGILQNLEVFFRASLASWQQNVLAMIAHYQSFRTAEENTRPGAVRSANRVYPLSPHTLYPFPTHPRPPNKAPYPPIAPIKE
ncbi:hypothetical protein [Pseudomonas syringae group genomosp. 3]|nr:hypothetical protein [Pseudomonas syringae group genomosp. 3]